MKHVLVLFVLVVLTVVGVRWFRSAPPPAPEAAPTVADAVAPREAGVASQLPSARAPEKPLFSAPRAPVKVEDPAIEPACKTLWADLGGLDLKEALGYPPRRVEIPAGDKCAGLPKKLDEKHKAFLAACGPFLNDPEKVSSAEWKAKAPQCQMAAFFYRAAVTDYLTKDEKLSDIKDPKVLADKLMNQFADNPKRAAEVAERLLEVEPGFYPAAKAVAMSRFMDAQERAGGDTKNPVWDQVKKDLDRASQMNPEDRKQQTELALLTELRRNNDPVKLGAQAERVARDLPNDAGGPYYAAWAAHLRGDKSSSINWLEEAMKRSPSDERLRESYEKVKRGEVDAFHADLSFNPGIR